MERALIFHTLQIEDTKDEGAIRTAYMKLLRSSNPEDDPDGFKRLREAYEGALALARQPQPLAAASDEKTDLQLWIDQVDRLYQDITRRWQPDAWKPLLEDPLCEALDTSFQTREAFLAWMTNHIYFPQKVLQLFDRVFQIRDDRGTLAEKFPQNFLDYLIHYIEHPEFLNYSLFRITDREHLDADGYIRSYLDIKRRVDQGAVSDCLRLLDELKAFGVFHPYENVERIRVFISSAEALEKEAKELPPEEIWQADEKKSLREQAAAQASQLADLLLDDYKDESYILLHCGLSRFHEGRKDEAYQLWQQILTELPSHYMAKFYSARYLLERQDYHAAKDLVLELLDVNGDDEELIRMVTTANEALIKEYKAKTEDSSRSEKQRSDDTLELCWCLFQNEHLEEALSLMAQFSYKEDQEYTYYSLYSRLLYRADQYEQALPLLEHWLKLIRQTPDDGTEESQKRKKREFQACHILSGCCHALNDREQALSYVDEAVSVAKNLRDTLAAMQYKAYLLFTYEQYERSIDACDQVLERDSQYYPAYLQRQEAAYKLHKGQQVVDDYYNAIRIYSGHGKPYLLAAKVFFYHDQFRDAKGVLDRAVENQVEFTDCMHLYEVKILRNLAQNRQDREKPMEIAKKLLETVDAANTDIEDISEITYEIGLLHWDNDDLEEAISHLRTAISQNPNRPQYHMICGHMYLDHREYRRSLAEYDLAEDAYGNSAALHYNRGLCHEALGMKELAMECYRESLNHAKIHRLACEKLSRYYKDRYSDTADPADYNEALSWINRQLEAKPTCHDFIERSLLYMNNYEFEPALRDCEEALKLNPDEWSVYNNMGCCYKWQGDYQKAIDYFRLAVEKLGNSTSMLPYKNLADCFEALEEYQTAIGYRLKVLKNTPDDEANVKDLACLYYYIEDYEKALKYFNQNPNHKDYYSDIGDLYFKMGDLKKALAAYREGVKKASPDQKAKRYGNLARYYMDQLLDFKKASYYFQKALATETDDNELHELEWELASLLFRMKCFDEAKKHAKKSLDYFSKLKYSSEENYLAYPAYRPARLFRQAWIYLCLGETEKGLSLFRQMTACTRCKGCSHRECFESYLFLGFYYETIDELDTALEHYQKAVKANPCSITAKVALDHLQSTRLNGHDSPSGESPS